MPSKASEKAVADQSQDKDAITMDRRRAERRSGDPEATDVGVMKTPRRKSNRRRHIDPTTCERDYNGEEIEFMQAMDDYKRSAGRMFPTCSEVLEVLRSLGYVKLNEEQKEALGIEFQQWQPESATDAEEADEEAELIED